MPNSNSVALAALALLATATPASAARPKPAQDRVLVFHRTAAFKHNSIPAGVAAIVRLGERNGFAVDETEAADAFTPANLAKYKAVVFLHTTGNVLPDPAERAALEGYIRHGGGYFGIHAASDMGPLRTEWPWYLGLVGAAFKGHTNGRIWSDTPTRFGVYAGKLAEAPADADTPVAGVRAMSWEPATVVVEQRASPLVRGWAAKERRADEWYGFIDNPRPNVRVVVSVDETTYTPAAGAMAGDHPIAWCHAYDGGRSVYTAMGHPIAAWSDAKFLGQVLGGIEMAMGRARFDCRPSGKPR